MSTGNISCPNIDGSTQRRPTIALPAAGSVVSATRVVVAAAASYNNSCVGQLHKLHTISATNAGKHLCGRRSQVHARQRCGCLQARGNVSLRANKIVLAR